MDDIYFKSEVLLQRSCKHGLTVIWILQLTLGILGGFDENLKNLHMDIHTCSHML